MKRRTAGRRRKSSSYREQLLRVGLKGTWLFACRGGIGERHDASNSARQMQREYISFFCTLHTRIPICVDPPWWKIHQHTFSIPSSSRPLFVPLGACGAAELRSSLPRSEESPTSPRRLCEGGGGCGATLPLRCVSISRFRLRASSLYSGVNLRRRCSGTQSSHL
jgi:hypothetical protein